MAKALVVVESPAKAKTIKRYLGEGYEVTASVGHIKDLPKNELGVDVAQDFRPDYVTIRGKGKILSEIKRLAKSVDKVYLAPDPDREGEAIAWHIADELGVFDGKAPPTYRVMINEITKKGVQAAISNPTEINKERFESQQARRILDRLVGYQLSPLLWDKVRRGLSAGRVQSVAVRLIVDRERQINAFVPQEYWSIKARLKAAQPPEFVASLQMVDGAKAQIGNETTARGLVSQAEAGQFVVAEVVKRESKRQPPAPFTTSKLQQEAARKLRFSPKLTMSVAQRLYEGVELGEDGAVGLITYMRTDSVRISDDALSSAREFIQAIYGAEYLPDEPRRFKTKKGAQDAHECIRPTNLHLTPERVEAYLSREQFRLYKLIWRRFVACQMVPAIFDQTRIDVANGPMIFRAFGSILKFAGFQAVYEETRDEDAVASEEGEDDAPPLPELSQGDVLSLEALVPEQHFTQAPPRFTEASLVRELEEQGIGRPSTYASIISVVQDKGYVEKRNGRLHPTELGSVVTDLLVENFPQILDVAFTASMEDELDKIEDGQSDWRAVLRDFHTPFTETLERAREEMRNLKREEIPTDIACDKCGSVMVIKWGRNGSFLACSGYPACKNSMEYTRDDQGKVVPVREEPQTMGNCPECQSPMIVKTGRFGRFLACSGYPTCKHTEPMRLGVPCPRADCEGELVEKRSKRKKVFYGCNRYPACDYATWNMPLKDHRCPSCDSAHLEEQQKRNQTSWKCPNCGFEETPEDAAQLASTLDDGTAAGDGVDHAGGGGDDASMPAP